MPWKVVVSDYDPAWVERYEFERSRLEPVLSRALGDGFVAIEHIGSTSVPGLAAKPIVDIMVGVAVLADAERSIVSMQQIGYDYISRYETILPERRFFHLDVEGVRTVHVHTVPHSSSFWRTHLAFRDALRTDEIVRSEYEQLKRKLARTCADDREAYMDGKAPFIEAVIRRVTA